MEQNAEAVNDFLTRASKVARQFKWCEFVMWMQNRWPNSPVNMDEGNNINNGRVWKCAIQASPPLRTIPSDLITSLGLSTSPLRDEVNDTDVYCNPTSTLQLCFLLHIINNSCWQVDLINFGNGLLAVSTAATTGVTPVVTSPKVNYELVRMMFSFII